MGPCVFYKKGYKYQLTRTFSMTLPFGAPFDISTEYIDFYFSGQIVIRVGYAWDGASGPTIDTQDSIRGSLLHDALYQLMRVGYLNAAYYRQKADALLRDVCEQDGMIKLRADAWYEAVRIAAGPAADPASEKRELAAPSSCMEAQ